MTFTQVVLLLAPCPQSSRGIVPGQSGVYHIIINNNNKKKLAVRTMKKSETELTAGILKERSKTHEVKENAFFIRQNRT